MMMMMVMMMMMMMMMYVISDGMTNGSEGMKYSLISRDYIPDSIEIYARGARMVMMMTK
jgi:dihydroxyacid dehydratase/phosphogluconate dehydratase